MAAPLDPERSDLGRLDGRLALRLLRYALPYRGRIALAAALVTVVPLFDLAGTIVVQHAVDGPLRQAVEGGSADAAAAWRGLLAHAAVYGAAILLLLFLRYAQDMALSRLGQSVLFDIRLELFRHLEGLPVAYFDRHPVGAMVTRLTNDVEALHQLFSGGVVSLIADLLLLCGITGLLFWFNAQLALVTVMAIPALLLATFVFRYFARKYYREQRTLLSRLNAFTHESIQGIDEIQLFTREADTARRFGAINAGYFRAFMRSVMAHALYFPAIEIISAVALVAIVWRAGTLMGLEGPERLSLGDFYLFWKFLDRFTAPIRDMAERYNVLQSAMAAAERIFGVLDAPAAAADPAAAAAPARLRGEVEFRGVSLSYNGVDHALEDFSCRIEPASTVALVGATGAGKSSAIALLAGLYEPQAGEILVDGLDLRRYQRQAYRRRLALVLQDPFIFSRTVLENIRLGHPGISEPAAIEAARRIGADEFIRRLPEGYATKLRERGATLSLGERQLISFARALAHDPDILILDEATAHIDAGAERRIQEALRELLRGRTAIVVAHRLSTVQRADRILVLHKGRLRESGTHQELLAQRGIYHRLYQLQFLGEAPAGASAPA